MQRRASVPAIVSNKFQAVSGKMNPPDSSPSPAQKLNRVQSAQHSLQSMIELAAVLREPGGCDWDRKQDFKSMQPHLLEEAHELIHAVSTGDLENFKEELADLLFLVVFFARLAEEQGWFDLYDAAAAGVEKLIFRHPHVFGDLEVSGAHQVLKNWEKLKEKEKARARDKAKADSMERTASPVDGSEAAGEIIGNADRQQPLPSNEKPPSEFGKNTGYLPGLHRAEKLQKKAALKGFDWTDIQSVRAKLDEELAELDELIAQLPGYRTEKGNAGAPDKPEESGQSDHTGDPALQAALIDELGDVLFCVVNLARHLNVPAELSIHETCEKFIRRFRAMEDMSSADLEDLSLDDLEELYQKAKANLSHAPQS